MRLRLVQVRELIRREPVTGRSGLRGGAGDSSGRDRGQVGQSGAPGGYWKPQPGQVDAAGVPGWWSTKTATSSGDGDAEAGVEEAVVEAAAVGAVCPSASAPPAGTRRVGWRCRPTSSRTRADPAPPRRWRSPLRTPVRRRAAQGLDVAVGDPAGVRADDAAGERGEVVVLHHPLVRRAGKAGLTPLMRADRVTVPGLGWGLFTGHVLSRGCGTGEARRPRPGWAGPCDAGKARPGKGARIGRCWWAGSVRVELEEDGRQRPRVLRYSSAVNGVSQTPHRIGPASATAVVVRIFRGQAQVRF